MVPALLVISAECTVNMDDQLYFVVLLYGTVVTVICNCSETILIMLWGDFCLFP